MNQNQNDYLREWHDHHQEYLSELLSQEAPPTNHKCSSCDEADGKYTCDDCFGDGWFCQSCCLADHRRHPFHRIKKWTGKLFLKTTLRELGFVLHLGHGGQECPNAPHADDMAVDGQIPTFDDIMVIVDKTGVYHHHVRWCACQGRPRPDILLFRMGLFSATLHDPKTAFTFDALQYFHIDSMECRTSASNFYSKLRRLTNEMFPDSVPVSVLL
jgi:hypothetical protein